ncbi:hypothetical protein [Tellurirhabdus rosea]|uniref:hypothetical protein n=1 Tax=Tellurirhabdus rosea TaxID=2674997 RepID=UPI00225B58E7|nr:hypothetical protein [Tellurirhabdus rosea]
MSNHSHSQVPHSTATTLIDSTVQAFDGGPFDTSIPEGLSLINDWLRSLKTSEAENIANKLQELRDELQNPLLDNRKLREILLALSQQTEHWLPEAGGEFPARLKTLAESLRNFANQIA